MSFIKRISRSLLFWTAACTAAWLALAKLVVPRIIRQAYAGESIPFINGLITGQDRHPVESYLANWDQATWRFTGFIIALGVIVWGLKKIDVATLWTRYWLRPAPLLDLGVVRMAAVGFETWFLISQYQRLQNTFVTPDVLYDPLPVMYALWPAAFFDVRPPVGFLQALFWLTICVGPLACAGLRTRITLKVFAYGSVFMHAMIYAFGDYHHPDALMVMALPILAFTPSGKAFSLDAWLARRRARAAGEPDPPAEMSIHAGWPRRVIQWMFALAYLSAAAVKLEYGGHDWLNGYTMRYYVIQDAHIKGGCELGLWMVDQHLPFVVLGWFTLIFEWTFFLPVFIKRLRWIYVPMGIGFHIGIYFALNADFFQYVFLYSVFVPWTAFAAWRAKRRSPE